MIITQTFAIKTHNPTNFSSVITVDHTNGHIPAMLVEYPDGNKFLAVVTKAQVLDFEHKDFKFTIEQYMWNNVFLKWDSTDSDKFFNSTLTVGNTFQVSAATGKWHTDMDAEELAITPLMGEADFFIKTLGKQILYPKVMGAIQKKFMMEGPVTPEGLPEAPGASQ